jgi:diadenosine tetraphosphatase ApaH/serine/threonine PP2A family protein phosphatase
MSETIFTFSGKAGDAIMQWPIAYWWSKQHGEKFTAWLDEKSCKLVAPLFAAQPCVEKVEFKEGVKSYQCGGQPWHFDLPAAEMSGRNVYHLGFRSFPERQLTLETQARCNVPMEVDIATLANTSSFEVPALGEEVNRLVLHGQGVCPHSRTTPGFWKFLASIRKEIAERVNEVVFVGSPADLEVARLAYPDWALFDDGGDFLKLAELMVNSRAVIGCGSSPAALAGALKVPCIRVHDPIGDSPRRLWNSG